MCSPADILSSAWDVANGRKAAVTQGNRVTNPTRVGAKVAVATRKHAAPALGLGASQQNTMFLDLAGLGMAQQNPLDSLFGSVGTDTMAGLGGLNPGLQSANSGNDLLQLAA